MSTVLDKTLIHPTWALSSERLRRMVELRYGIDFTSFKLSTLAPDEGWGGWYNPLSCRAAFSYKVLDNPLLPMPLGPVTELSVQLQEPALFGALAVAFCPQVWSPWRATINTEDTDSADDARFTVATLLDQPRAEMMEVRHRPVNRLLMQALHTHSTNYRYTATAHDAILLLVGIYTRIRCGLIKGERLTMLEDFVRGGVESELGDDTTATLLSIAEKALHVDGDDAETMLRLADEWINVVDSLDTTDINLFFFINLVQKDLESMTRKDVKALRVLHPPAVTFNQYTMAPRSPKEWAQHLDQVEGDGDDDEDLDFSDLDGPDDDDIDNDDPTVEVEGQAIGVPQSRWIEYRDPSDKERADAVALSRKLRELRYRAPSTTRVRSQIPHGRMNTRQLVQMTAQRTQGTRITAAPWEEKQYIQAEQPGLTCALVLDTSRSMDLHRHDLVSLNWVLAHATTAVGGTISTWGFGGDVFEVIRAGTRPRRVPEIVDSGAGSAGAARALAHAAADVDLANASGTRVAVVVTDASLGEEEIDNLSNVYTSLRDQGVHTILLHLNRLTKKQTVHGTEYVPVQWGSDLAPELSKKILDIYAP